MSNQSTSLPVPEPEKDEISASYRGKTWTISDLAREFDLTTRAIRFYEDEGLLHPRRNGRTRIYTLRDRTRLKLVLRGKRLGFSLGEIADMFQLYDSEPGESGQLKHILGKVSERKSQLEGQLRESDIREALKEAHYSTIAREIQREARLRLGLLRSLG